MIGDDVVDLADPETCEGAQHPGFDARVFAPSELALLDRTDDRRRLRWTLWSAKEAAYKAAKRCAPATVFSPRRFVVTRTRAGAPCVVHGAERWRLTIDAGAERVHTIACAVPTPCRVISAVETVPSEAVRDAMPTGASRAARALAVTRVARALGASPDAVAVVKEGRVPRLVVAPADARSSRSRDGGIALSLSHHGRFVSFACLLDPEAEREERAA